MKKAIVIISLCLVLIVCAVFVVSRNLPAVISGLLGRYGIPVRIEKAHFFFSDGTLAVDLGDLSFKGPVSGKIGQISSRIFISDGIFFDSISMKDFNLVISDEIKMGKKDFSTKIGLLEISNGVVTAAGRKLVVGSIVAQNINTKKPIKFFASITDPDHAGKVRVVGSSVIEKNRHRIKGSIEVDAFGLEKIDSILNGVVNGKGEFTLYDGVLTLAGNCNSPKLVLRDTWLKKPLIVDRVTARSTITAKGPDVNIAVYDTGYADAPFTVNVKMKDFAFARLDITSGPVPLSVVREYVKMDDIGYDVWAYVKDGFLKMKRLTYEKDHPFTANLELSRMTGTYNGNELTDISGNLDVEESKGTISEGKGYFKASKFYDLKGTINFGKKPWVRLMGKYTVDLTHIPYFTDLKEVTISKGWADGAIELDSRNEKGLAFGGSGKINNAAVEWKGQSFTVNGPFQLSGQELLFSTITISGNDTSLALNGRWGPKGFTCFVKGYADSRLIGAITGKTVRISGKVQFDSQVMIADSQITTSGNINMDDVAYGIPGYFKKAKGVPCRAQVRLTRKKTGDIIVDDISGNLDVINVQASGTISNGRKIDSKVAVRTKDSGRAASLFNLNGDLRGGEANIDLAVKDLVFPLTRLPWVVGNVQMRKGFLKIPWMPHLMKDIDLNADFRGYECDVVVNSLTTGSSVVKKATLKVNGFEAPKFDMVVGMDRLDAKDFRSGGDLTIRSIQKDSVLASSSGKISIRARDVSLGSVPAKDLEINAFMTDRKINVSDLKLRVFNGDADIKGMVDLSGPVPSLYAHGRLARIGAGVFFAAMGGTSQEITGDAHIMGTLKSEGTTWKSLKANLNGDTSAYSRNGVIKRWNLLSKIFALLNVYDLVRGKIVLGKDGLLYKKMGASFTIDHGVYHTKNFLLDSQSMVITGAGDIDLNKETIDATLEVSPLVALDRTIDKIPVLRSIIKNKNKGFLYVTYSVKGPFDDPDITTNYVGTVGTKSLEILRNILVFPKEVFEAK
ncbi:MAG: AsmA-like C-terminal domain-containing protein [Syntrophorhabdaceae bacterium]|nr:AsmA-like C-terminal domain-containing protein [Syntrophorhabdaceae bacterium]